MISLKKEWRWLVYAIFFVCAYFFHWLKALSFVWGHNIMDCDFIIAVSTVAIAVNGVTTISKTIKASLVSSDQNARDAFVAYILNLISILSCENNNKKQELTEVQDRAVKDLNNEELTEIVTTKEKIDKNDARIQRLLELVPQARSAQIKTSQMPDDFEKDAFLFACCSILILVFSPQIDKLQIHNSLLIVLFLPQFDLLCRLMWACVKKHFPLKYLVLVWKTQEQLGEKILAVWCFEKSVWTFRPKVKDQISQSMGNITFTE